ncbi:MAG: hypothetical protein EOO77_24045 [Oxalobacteraceae bacterium]|nr:MAG: hypothetical protein EOO77_24045 [Oxalobacteraceae bacterium]
MLSLWASAPNQRTSASIPATTISALGALAFVLDTTAPVTTVVLVNDTGTSNADRFTSSAVITGSGDAGSVVTIRKGTTVLGTTTANGKGQWIYSPVGLSDGAISLTATETDAAGNSATARIAITLDTIAPKPAAKIITGLTGGRITLAGVSEANSLVTVVDTTSNASIVVGTATTASNGVWSLTSQAAVDTSKIHTYTTSATDLAGNFSAMPGCFILADTGNDILKGSVGVSDVFAFMSFKGTDVINGFEASSVVGANHDYINFSGRGITSFGQVQSMMSGTTSTIINIGSGKTITVANIAPSLFTATDFRYS